MKKVSGGKPHTPGTANVDRHVEGTPVGLRVTEGVRAQKGLARRKRETDAQTETERIVSHVDLVQGSNPIL
ncbi:unnamed protein product [Pleuronectes platessa]|uniref:Uncharacterized protein n=1 Tax=Pleuronectes platessa TaxID=8262 RepID=A0A9N7VXA9_PLEPL|nr:unnamed protein product [Pleuronectes platessa]